MYFQLQQPQHCIRSSSQHWEQAEDSQWTKTTRYKVKHKQNQAPFRRKSANLHSAALIFPPNTIYICLQLSILSTLKKTIHHSWDKAILSVNPVRKSILTKNRDYSTGAPTQRWHRSSGASRETLHNTLPAIPKAPPSPGHKQSTEPPEESTKGKPADFST